MIDYDLLGFTIVAAVIGVLFSINCSSMSNKSAAHRVYHGIAIGITVASALAAAFILVVGYWSSRLNQPPVWLENGINAFTVQILATFIVGYVFARLARRSS